MTVNDADGWWILVVELAFREGGDGQILWEGHLDLGNHNKKTQMNVFELMQDRKYEFNTFKYKYNNVM